MHNLISLFKKIGAISPENKRLLLESITKRHYPAKTLLQDQGRISNRIYFVEAGIARTFYYKDGRDITYWIAVEGDFVGSMSSYFLRQISVRKSGT